VDGASLTYAELWERLRIGGLELRELGIGRGDRVALVLDDGPELAVAFLAVASAAACAPLNPAYREHELDFYLSDLGAAAVVVRAGVSSPARAVAERLGLLLIELEPDETGDGTFTLRAEGPSRAGDRSGADGVALLLHTSGTTARPKLVPLTHANLCASADAVAASLALTPDDRCLAVMPLFHIHGLVAAVLAPLAAGSTVIASRGFDSVHFLDRLETARPTWYTAVPSMHMAVLERARADRERARAAGLRLVRSSSAPLPVTTLEGLEDVFGCPVIEAYGMTEAAHQMAANPLPPGARKPGSVGLPAGPDVTVLDDQGAVLGLGEVGEVAVRGPSVFGGYEANPEANRDAFSDGWFRTGDQGFLDADGYLFLQGRLKEIINRGGEKVSPLEVEETMRAHPAVRDVVVFAQPHEQLGEDVAAAVVLQEGTTTTEPGLQRFTASRLAPFKVPRTVTFLDELPRGPTGKVQRVGLSERLGLPTLGVYDHERPAYAEPRTSLERRLCELFEELLAVERIGVHDDFFALGGDSLHVAQLLAQIDAERGAASETPACVLLRAPTVERLAAVLEGDDRSDGRVLAVEPRRAGSPFFFFPTHDWSTVGLGALAHRLESDHSVSTFRLDAGDLPVREPTVAGLAAMFAADIRSVQPDGPYYLGGHCFGAALALEVARMLESEGEDVAALVLVNPIGEHPSRLRTAARYARRGTLLAWIRRRRRARRQEAEARELRPAAAVRFEAAMARAGAAYVPVSYPGRATVLAGVDYLTPKTFWDPLVRELDWRQVPGVTNTLFRPPHVDSLAREMSAVLA
jgi:acyl-CoA synthetase (AMP-forming)/AMP-acid ligase II/thioesterase domain-containing protein